MSTPLSWLQSEIYQRMLEKLEPIKVLPNEILLQPDFPGLGLRQLVKRFPRAQIDTVADSHLSLHQQMRLRMQRLFRGLLNRGTLLHQNPSSRENHYGLMISCLELQHYERPQDWIEIAHRQIREDGLLCFSYLGPDTGKELRTSPQASPYLKNLPGALDMHDIGDALVQKASLIRSWIWSICIWNMNL
jgi:malonyl-CoA O-methyltransferase